LKQHIARIGLGLALMLLFAGHVGNFYNIGVITRLDNIIYDFRLALTMPGGVDPRVVILDIDERSLDQKALGRWPWRRDKISVLLKKLFDESRGLRFLSMGMTDDYKVALEEGANAVRVGRGVFGERF